MPTRLSDKTLVTAGLCLLGGSLLLGFIHFLLIRQDSIYYAGAFITAMLDLLGYLVYIAGFSGAAILAGGLVVRALTSPSLPTAPAQHHDGYATPTGYQAPQASAPQASAPQASAPQASAPQQNPQVQQQYGQQQYGQQQYGQQQYGGTYPGGPAQQQ